MHGHVETEFVDRYSY